MRFVCHNNLALTSNDIGNNIVDEHGDKMGVVIQVDEDFIVVEVDDIHYEKIVKLTNRRLH